MSPKEADTGRRAAYTWHNVSGEGGHTTRVTGEAKGTKTLCLYICLTMDERLDALKKIPKLVHWAEHYNWQKSRLALDITTGWPVTY